MRRQLEQLEQKPFKRAGIQPDGSLIQLISRQIDGEWRPPHPGQTTTCKEGRFKVEVVTNVFHLPTGQVYYQAKGDLI